MPQGTWQASGHVAQQVVGQIEEAEMGVFSQLAVQIVNSVVGQVEGEYIVLQAFGQVSQTPVGAVYLPVAAAAGAHGGTYG